jgi:hypothetical protein
MDRKVLQGAGKSLLAGLKVWERGRFESLEMEGKDKERRFTMALAVSPTDILHQIAGTLVAQKKHRSVEEALREIALSAIRNKIASYRRRISRLEHKHGKDFATFSAQLQGRAMPADEDDWFAWRSALGMLADWQQVYQDLIDERSR